jgi:hypothetical protein
MVIPNKVLINVKTQSVIFLINILDAVESYCVLLFTSVGILLQDPVRSHLVIILHSTVAVGHSGFRSCSSYEVPGTLIVLALPNLVKSAVMGSYGTGFLRIYLDHIGRVQSTGTADFAEK